MGGQIFRVAGMVVFIILAGCDEYELKLRPEGPRMQRSVVYRRTKEGEAVPADVLERFQAAYGTAAVRVEGNTATAAGVFEGAVPGDIHGAGQYQYFIGALGTVGIYMERFGGNHDLASTAEQQLAAAARLTEFLRGYLSLNLSTQPGWDRLDDFLTKTAPADLKALALRLKLADIAGNLPAHRSEDVPKGEEMRDAVIGCLLMLQERGYFSATDLPALAAAGVNPNGPSQLVKLIVSRKFKPALPQELVTALLTKVEDPTIFKTEFGKYVAGTDYWKNRPAARQEEHPAEALVRELLTIDLFGGVNHGLKVLLDCPSVPVHSNGLWQPETGSVCWNQGFGDNQQPPRMLYAAWAQPDPAVLNRLFGRATVPGDRLMNAVLVESALSAEARKLWLALLNEVTTPGELAGALETLNSLAVEGLTSTDREALNSMAALLAQMTETQAH